MCNYELTSYVIEIKSKHFGSIALYASTSLAKPGIDIIKSNAQTFALIIISSKMNARDYF